MKPQPEQNDEELEPIPHDEGTAEMKASRLGWVPKEEYRGKQPWVDAEEYLARLEEDSPKLRHVNKKLAREIEELKNTNAAILAHHERALVQERKDAYDRAYADAETKHEQAVAAGDVAGASKAVTTMKALDAQLANPAPAPVVKKSLSAEDQALVNDFVKANSEWYGIDKDMTEYARNYETKLKNDGIPLDERLEMVLEKVKRKYPQEFPEMNNDALDDELVIAPRTPTPSRQAAPVGRNNSSSVRRPAPRIEPGSYEALTSKGRSACDSHVRGFPEAKKAAAKASWLKYARNEPSLFQS